MVQRVALHPKPRPRFIEPMECQRVAKLPEGEQWLYEPKQDGYRVIAVIEGNTTVLHSMSGLNYTAKYPHIAEALKWLKLQQRPRLAQKGTRGNPGTGNPGRGRDDHR